MKKLIASILMCVCSTSFADVGAKTDSLLYVSIPLDGRSAREKAPLFGFMVRSRIDIDGSARPRYVPVVDLQFKERSELRLLGLKVADGEAQTTEAGASGYAQLGLMAAIVSGVALLAAAQKDDESQKKARKVCPYHDFTSLLYALDECTKQ